MALAFALPSVWGEETSPPSVDPSAEAGAPQDPLAAYQAFADSRARDYDRAQDISARQMVLLLEVSERTGANLGHELATGEHESAHTWNDYVRPSLKSGNLGSATGVWQFQPATFHGIIRMYGSRLLTLSAADPASDRDHLDLGDGPFTDEQVRGIIKDTVDGERAADDQGLQLLRHNFAVLAFARHFLSVDSGAATPEEDFLFHFLGAGQARRVLALARGEARDTLSVKPVELPVTALAEDPAHPFGEGTMEVVESEIGLDTLFPPATELPGLGSIIPDLPPPISSEWGFPADSPIVTGNLGMFYRDGKGQSDPYTWAEFMDHLARRIRAQSQPALVRAKYGVGFGLNGGDIPGRAFDPDAAGEPVEFRYRGDKRVLVPEAMVTGPLDGEETARYRQRLAALVSQGDDAPTDVLPPESLAALHHLGVLSPEVRDQSIANPKVQAALAAFREKVGKAEPDDPDHLDRLMPAERIALEAYDLRIGHYAGLQACQAAASAEAPDLNRFKDLPAGPRRSAAPHVAAVQTALAERGLLERPIKKTVWRDKKRRKRTSYKTLPFAGKPDKATVAALDSFQLRHGLAQTGGILDAVTLELLGLPAMGQEIFLPPAGPECALKREAEAAPRCEIATRDRWTDLGALRRHGPQPVASLVDHILRPVPEGLRVDATDEAPQVSDDADSAAVGEVDPSNLSPPAEDGPSPGAAAPGTSS